MVRNTMATLSARPVRLGMVLLQVLILAFASTLPALAQTLDPKGLVVPAAELGPNWVFVSESTEGSSEQVALYSVTNLNATDFAPPRVTYFVVGVHPSEISAALDVESTPIWVPNEGGSTEVVEGLGDSRGFKVRFPVEGNVGIGYMFRVSRLVSYVQSSGPAEQEADITAQALDFAHRQEARLRAALGTTAATPPAPSAPYCAPGATPHFQGGFAQLKAQVGDPMGEALECEHANPENGDVLQATSTGLAVYEKATNTPTFTNGYDHWALTATGLVHWVEGEPRPEGPPQEPPPAGLPGELMPAWQALARVAAPEGSGQATLGALVASWLAASNTQVVVGPLDGAWGAYNARTNTITIAPQVATDLPEAAAAVLVHEARHAMQQAEGESDCVSREVDAMRWEQSAWELLTAGAAVDPATELQHHETNLHVLAQSQGDPGLYKLVVDTPGYQDQCTLWVPTTA